MYIRIYRYCILLIISALAPLLTYGQGEQLTYISSTDSNCWDTALYPNIQMQNHGAYDLNLNNVNYNHNLSSNTDAEDTSSNIIEQLSSTDSEKRPFYMVAKTNLLYDALLVPNVGVEFHLGKRISVGANGVFAWWNSDKKSWYWRIYGCELIFRKYFGGKSSNHPLTGHHVGLYGQAASYDFELGADGILSNFSYGAGIDYGYSFAITNSLNLDLTLGFGYIGGKYKVYEPADECYIWKENRLRNYMGPSKAEISLVWLVGNNKTKKGCRR